MSELLEPAQEIVPIEANPSLAILDSQKFEEFYEKVKAEAETVTSDTSTPKSREEIRAMAYKITKTKTAIDKARLGLTEEWRNKTKRANEAGKLIENRLSALAEKVRAPLTEWENAEKLRAEKHEKILKFLKNASVVGFDDNSATLSSRISSVLECELDLNVHGVAIDVVQTLKTNALNTLNAALERAKIEEAERAELERFRKEAAEREAKAQAEADKRAEQERIESERQAAIEAAIKQKEQEHLDELAAERARADRLEREAKEAAERQAALEAQEEAARIAREQDREHRSKIMGAAKTAIMNYGIDETIARNLVLAIAAGNIPSVTIRF